MEEKNIVVAKTSVSPVEKLSANTKQQSLMGVLFPLVAPVCVLLHMWTEAIRFNALGGFAKFLFWGGMVASVTLFVLHQKAVQLENEKVKEAERVAAKQSLIVTNQRIYGNNGQSSFSYVYNDIVKAYSTMVQGSTPQLAIKLCNGRVLEFKYIENLQTVVSCINDAKKNNENINNSTIFEKEKVEVVQKESPKPQEDIENSKTEMKAEKEIKTETKEEAMSEELFNVVISSAIGSMQQIKVLRQSHFSI